MQKRWLEPHECIEFLERENVGRLGTSKDNIPYVIPVNFVVFGDKIYIHTGFRGKKIDILKANPIVCFEASRMISLIPSDKACTFSVEFMSVIVSGKAARVEDADLKYKVLQAFSKKYSFSQTEPELKKEDANFVHIIEITMDEITGRACSNPQ